MAVAVLRVHACLAWETKVRGFGLDNLVAVRYIIVRVVRHEGVLAEREHRTNAGKLKMYAGSLTEMIGCVLSLGPGVSEMLHRQERLSIRHSKNAQMLRKLQKFGTSSQCATKATMACKGDAKLQA